MHSQLQAARKTMPALTTSGANNDQPSDWSDGGPGGLAPPRHQSVSDALQLVGRLKALRRLYMH